MENNTWYNLPKDIKKEIILPLKNIISSDAYKVLDKSSKWYSLPKNLTTAFKTLVEEYNRLNITNYSINSKEFVWYNLPRQIYSLCELSLAIQQLFTSEPILKKIDGVNEGDILCIEETTTMFLEGLNLSSVTSIKINNVEVSTFTIINNNRIEFIPIILAEYPQTNYVCELVAENSVGQSNILTFNVKNDFEVDPITINNIELTEANFCVGDTFQVACNTGLTEFKSSNEDILRITGNNGTVDVIKEGVAYIYADLSYDSGSGAPIECGRSYLKITATPEITINKNIQSITKLEGTDNTFIVNAENVDSYQWQVSEDGLTWSDLTNDSTYNGVNTNSLTISNISTDLNEFVYKCVLNGISPCSNLETFIAQLVVNQEAGETSQPENFNAVVGQFVAFTAGLEGDVQSIQWYVDEGLGLEPLTNDSTYSGVNTDQLFINSASSDMNGLMYSAEVTTTTTTFFTASAVLTVS